MSARPDFRNPRSTEFRRVTAAFLSQPGLPFASVLSAERIGRIFARHGNLFGLDQIYSTAVMVWSFLCQLLHDGSEVQREGGTKGEGTKGGKGKAKKGY